MADLVPFEGRDVLGTRVAITRAGDGLSKAMEIEPTVLEVGDTVIVVLECTVDSVRHERVKDTDCLIRLHRLRAGVATLLDAPNVRKAIASQRRRLDDAAGRTPLFDDDEGDEQP